MADDDATNEDNEAQDLLADAVQSGNEQNQGEQESDPQAELDKLRADRDKWKSLARKHEGKAKENTAAATELAELKESQKSEQQKLQDKLAEAEVELAKHRTERVRADAVREAGLDADMAQFITEVEPEAALEQAKRLAERMKPAEPQRPANLMQGARQTSKPAQDPNAWLRQAAGLG